MILDLFRKDIGFDNIQGYDDIKNIVRRALSSEENYNLLLCGPPASEDSILTWNIRMQKWPLLRWSKHQ
jgi:hypothetical protein